MRKSNTLIKNSVFECDKQVLTLSIVESLLNIIPTESELSAYTDDVDKDNLGNADLFFFEISVIPAYGDRL